MQCWAELGYHSRVHAIGLPDFGREVCSGGSITAKHPVNLNEHSGQCGVTREKFSRL